MSYEKQNFSDGQTLTAAHLNHMEDGIATANETSGGTASLTIGTVTSGSTASASITDGKLNLVLPKGDKGDPGDAGVGGSLSATEKTLMLSLFENAAYSNASMQSSYNALKSIWGGETPTIVPVTAVTLSQTALSLTAGGTATLTATVLPANATDRTVTWSISPSGYASLSSTSGSSITVTASKSGSCTITATAGGKSATCAVTVTAATAVEDVPGETPVYKLAEAKTFVPANKEYIDTGIKMFKSIDPKPSYTVLFEVQYGDSVTAKGDTWVLMHCMEETRPWPGVAVQVYASGNLGVNMYTTAGMNIEYLDWLKNYRTKCAVRMTDTELKRWTGRFDPTTSEISGYTSAVDKSLILGAYQQSDGTKGRFFDGTLYQCLVYDKALTDEQVAAWIAG